MNNISKIKKDDVFVEIPDLTEEIREERKQEALHMIYEALKHRLKKADTSQK